MKARPVSQHEQMAQAVERSLRQAARHLLQGAALEGCLRLWRDFAARVDLSKTRKPEVWAAALAYTFERLRMSGSPQAGIAQVFRVSPITVSQKHRQIAEALNLVALDARYLTEAMRAAVEREHGPWPEDLPLREVPTGGWGWRPPIGSVADLEEWFEEREQGPLRQAQDLVYDGWEALDELLGSGDPKKAERCFRAALRLDPTLADAHNGLGNVAGAREDFSTAEAHYRKAYRLARDALGSESRQAFHWWLELETRPYMRAREGLGWVYWQTGRYREAIAEYEALLKLNKNDNQGARYLIGPLYQLAGDLEGALRAYERFARHYPRDMGDPHQTFCWGLALSEAGRRQEAASRWRQAFFQNIYIAPMLLGDRLPEEAIWYGSNLEWPDYAEDYLDLYETLWTRVVGALDSLRRLWNDPEVRADVKRWLALGGQLEELAESARGREPEAEVEWRRLVKEQQAIEERVPSPELLARVVGES